ncbi:MAG: TonB-dependent receptor [Pseudomonadota bacterium]
MIWGKLLVHSFTCTERPRKIVDSVWRRLAYVVAAVGLALLLATSTAQSSEATDVVQFDIPAQRADMALMAFAEQADLTLVFSVEEVRDKQANAVSGRFTLAQAANLLLDGTGLNATFGSELVLKVVDSAAAEPQGSDMNEKPEKRGILAGIAAALVGAGAGAQEASTDSQFALDEIVVTAQRREEGVQSIPLAVTALDRTRLTRAGVLSPDRLELLTPNLTFSQSGSSPRFSLRGVSATGAELNADPVVGVFVDGVYQSRTAQAMAGFVDLERVEVVRGPQGTLYGRNTTGGSINLISRKPSVEDYEFGMQATAGDFSHFNVRGFVNVPINDRVAFRFAGLHEVRDGWAENLNLPDDTNNDEDQNYFRGSLLVDVSERAELLFRANYWIQDGQGSGFNAYKVRGTALEFDGAFNFENNFAFFGTGGDPGGNPSEPHEYSDNLPGVRDIEQLQLSMDFTYDFGSVTFKSITSLNEFDRFIFRDADYTEVDIFDVVLEDEVTTFTQEIQLASNETDPLSWVIGAFFLNDEIDENLVFGNGAESAFFVPGSDFINRVGFLETDSIAVFGQATWTIKPSLRLTTGIRWTEDEKTFRIDSNGFPAPFQTSGTVDFSDVTWRFALDYDLSEQTLLYGYIAKGFKSGGFNLTPNPAFDSETVITYELGAKHTIRDLGFLNFAAFFNDFDDLQVNSFDPDLNSSFVRNAATATSSGLEVEMELSPGDVWRLVGSVAYLNAEYDDFVVDNPLAAGVNLVSLAGRTPPRAPGYSAKLAVSRDFRLPNGSTLTPLVQLFYSDEYFQTEFNQELDRQDSFSRTDIRLFWQAENSQWSAEAFITNISDEDVLINGVYGPGNTMFANYGAPRTFGFRVGYNY